MKIGTTILIAASALSLFVPAKASIIYKFTVTYGQSTGGWRYTSADYITPIIYTGFPTSGVGTQLTLSSLDSCYSLPLGFAQDTPTSCSVQTLTRSSSFTPGSPVKYDIIFYGAFLGSNPIPSFTPFYFQEGVLGQVGTHETVVGRGAVAGTLDVIDTSSVPEPETWVTFIAGFGVIGGAMRRRRRVIVRFA